jgi:hypothetical protein
MRTGGPCVPDEYSRDYKIFLGKTPSLSIFLEGTRKNNPAISQHHPKNMADHRTTGSALLALCSRLPM